MEAAKDFQDFFLREKHVCSEIVFCADMKNVDIVCAVITNNLLPSWLAPNLITLTGLLALVIAYGINSYFCPNFETPESRWMYFLVGACVFFYLHMDALDGKQARRTKTSSPLGQLFDHGCDALAVHIILVTMVTSLQLKHEWRAVVAMMYVYVPWWLAHWEEYHTGVMLYGNGLWGVTEANYAVVLLHVYTFLFGPRGWTTKPFSYILPSSCSIDSFSFDFCEFLGSLGINDTLLLIFGALGLQLFFQQVIRVFRLAGSRMLEQTTLPKEEKGNKSLGLRFAAFHLLQILATAVCGICIMSIPAPANGQSRVHYATFGLTYALEATRSIMAHMSKEPFRIAVWPLLLIVFQVLNHIIVLFDEVLLAYAVNAVILVGYLHYVVSLINEICAYLGINVLTIRKVAVA